ncbi:hypothetical protein [Photobacterium lutimaris]|uniref:Uncharacterized protein n=1 Tax=Photobacterium lutimaris TaxID=388278 RepID=A0A2T3IHE9_9GAMM|nr:hypothetical protein [Photobacterium lutimaris]PSU27067.1 hypothetical protein C9I99_26760 [Photobacterium lutimaris]TDR69156.1 hypothetical protein DFP78_1421 [Photobacterium lutimaris]
MKFKYFAIVVSVLMYSSISNAGVADNLDFGSALLQQKFVDYENKHSECISNGQVDILPDSVIVKLKHLPNVAAEGLGYLSQEAVRECSQPEYSDLMRMLLVLEMSNTSTKKPNHLSKQITTIKKLMFSVVDLNVEKNYHDLPEGIKHELHSIELLKKPFNLIDAYERAWN